MTITKNSPNRTDQQVSDQALIDGLAKHAGVLTTLVIGGITYKPSDLVTTLQGRIAARTAAAAAKPPWLAAVQAEEAEITTTQPLISGLRQAIQTAFAKQVAVLADFAMKPRKTPAPRTPAQKAASAAKARATRAARHTMGPVARSKITGESAAAAAAPVTDAPATAPAAAATSSVASASPAAPTPPKS